MPDSLIVPEARYRFQLRYLIQSRNRLKKVEKELAERESELAKANLLFKTRQILEERLAETTGELAKAKKILDQRKTPCETCESPSRVLLTNCGHAFCRSCAHYLFVNLERNETTDQLKCPCDDNGPAPAELSHDEQPRMQQPADNGSHSTGMIATEGSERREVLPGMQVDEVDEGDTDILDDSEMEEETNVVNVIDETQPSEKIGGSH